MNPLTQTHTDCCQRFYSKNSETRLCLFKFQLFSVLKSLDFVARHQVFSWWTDLPPVTLLFSPASNRKSKCCTFTAAKHKQMIFVNSVLAVFYVISVLSLRSGWENQPHLERTNRFSWEPSCSPSSSPVSCYLSLRREGSRRARPFVASG